MLFYFCYNDCVKVTVDIKRTLTIFIIVDLVFAALLFLSCINLFLFTKFGVLQVLIILLYVGVSIIMLVLSLKRNFYVIESKYIVAVRGFKNMYYHFNDVVYIDKAQSEKKRVLCFYTNKGHVRYLPFDKNGEIYKAMIKKCHNLLDDEQFKAKYPNVKL